MLSITLVADITLANKMFSNLSQENGIRNIRMLRIKHGSLTFSSCHSNSKFLEENLVPYYCISNAVGKKANLSNPANPFLF